MVDSNAYANGELDREIVLSRVIDAPRDLVFRAWVEPDRMFQWFGPRGFRCDVREVCPLTAGAVWRFDMIAPGYHGPLYAEISPKTFPVLLREGSRLSQILQHTKDIKEHGEKFDPRSAPTTDPSKLSLLGIGDYTNHLIENSHGVMGARKKLNDDYLQPLSFSGDTLQARVRISGNRDDSTRLRQLLEKLEVILGDTEPSEGPHCRGMGSNNILFMACELLLLGTEVDGFPLLIVEEPEAHLHPQRQLRLMAFLQAQAERLRADGQRIQIIRTARGDARVRRGDVLLAEARDGARVARIVRVLARITRSGVGIDVAGQLLVTAGDNPDRLHTPAAFVHLCGVAPIPVSSGRSSANRLNRGGDRAANAALYRIAICRLRWDPNTRAFIDKKIKEGKTKKGAIRCLKHYIAREIYNDLRQITP